MSSLVLILLFNIYCTPFVYASRAIEFSHNLGGLPISCSIYREQASLKNICVGYSERDVRAILGKPSWVNRKEPLTLYYKNGLSLKFVNYGGDGIPLVVGIKVTGNSGYSTLDGIKVGMSEKDIIKVYGEPDTITTEMHKAPKLSAEKNKKYERLNKTIYTYYANPMLTLSFTLNNGIIKSIDICQTD